MKKKLKADKEKCKGCMLCISACPHGLLKESEDINSRGVKYVFLENADKCTGCGLCVMMCPDCGLTLE